MSTVLDLEARKAKAAGIPKDSRRRGAGAMEIRQSDSGLLTFAGLASSTSVRDQKTGDVLRDNGYDMGWYTERIIAGAFGKTLREQPDVQFLINHEGLPLARTTIPAGQPGHLSLDERDGGDGLTFEATASADDPDAARLAAKVSSGLMDQCSFGFRATRQSWDEDYENRDILEVSLHRGDVSVVNYGANPNTPVTMRSLLLGLSDVSDDTLSDLRDDPEIITVIRRLTPVQYSPQDVLGALTEVRAGAALSSTAVATLKHVLSLASTADNAVDEAQAVLAQFLGVPNPDADAAPSDDSGNQSSQQNALSLDYARAQAFALGIR